MNNKSYRVFVNRPNRIISAVILLVFVMIGTLIMWWFNEEIAFLFLIYINAFAVMASVVMDHFSFGGLCAKEGIELGFLKSAKDGIAMVRHVVLTDLFIRMAWNMIIVILPIALGCVMMGYGFNFSIITVILGMLFIELFGQSLGVTIGRHQSTIFIKGMSAGLVATMITFCEYIIVLDSLDENGPSVITRALIAFGAAAFIITSFVTIKDANRSLDKSYVG